MRARSLLVPLAPVFLAVVLTGCGGSDKPAHKADYAGLYNELHSMYPDDGWTRALAKQAGDNVCKDLGSFSYEDVVKNRATANGGDRAPAQELVVASVNFVCPEHSDKVPGMN